MKFSERPDLCQEERAYETAAYYDIEPIKPGVLEQMILDQACPMDPKDAIPAESFTDLVANIEQYSKGEFGYCMFDNKRGYLANYLYWKKIRPEMTRWWYRWINIKPQGVPDGCGSLHYKIWYPGEHIDHGYINGKDRFGGYFADDYDSEGNIIRTYRYPLNILDFGISQGRLDELRNAGYGIDCAWETGEGGMHLSLNVTRSLPNGDVEKRTRTWIGYGVRDGKVVADENACCTEEMLRNILSHQSIEGNYLESLLPELYKKFSGRPEDTV